MLPAVGPSPLNVNPVFEIGPLEPRYSEWLVFEGISVDEKGVQHYLGKLSFGIDCDFSCACTHPDSCHAVYAKMPPLRINEPF